MPKIYIICTGVEEQAMPVFLFSSSILRLFCPGLGTYVQFSWTDFSAETQFYFNWNEGVPTSNLQVPDSNQSRENSLKELI